MNARRAPLALVVASALFIMPHRAMAQDIGASYETLHSRHELFGTLRGSAIELASERAGIFALRLSYRRATGSHFRIGNTCSGFIVPGTVCEIEYLRDLTSLGEGGVSADLRVFHGRRVDANNPLTAGFGAVRFGAGVVWAIGRR